MALATAGPALAAPPPNDDPAGAELIPSAGPFPYYSAVTPDITDATTTGEPTPSCAFNGSFSRSIWYVFTPPYNTQYTVAADVSGTTVVNTVLAIYTSAGGAGGPFTQVACDDDGITYQLTCIGGYAPVFVAKEVQDNTFTIGGGTAGLKVSWQITAVRDDPYLHANRLAAEVNKTPAERDKYLYPQGYGKSADQSILNDQAAPPPDLRLPFGAKEGAGKKGTPMRRALSLLVCLLVLALPPAALAQSGGPYDLTWSNIGAGGSASGGAYTLSGTAGQPDAAALSGGSLYAHRRLLGRRHILFSLPEDIDGDGQVTVLDVQADASAWRMANPAFPYDQNNDGDVDVQDIMLVAAAFGSAC